MFLSLARARKQTHTLLILLLLLLLLLGRILILPDFDCGEELGRCYFHNFFDLRLLEQVGRGDFNPHTESKLLQWREHAAQDNPRLPLKRLFTPTANVELSLSSLSALGLDAAALVSSHNTYAAYRNSSVDGGPSATQARYVSCYYYC
jgi:hypothetical protein